LNGRVVCRGQRASAYQWGDAYQKYGEVSLKNAKSFPKKTATSLRKSGICVAKIPQGQSGSIPVRN
jgi:hypothetical protein